MRGNTKCAHTVQVGRSQTVSIEFEPEENAPKKMCIQNH